MAVGLPSSFTRFEVGVNSRKVFDYQSECHCSKTTKRNGWPSLFSRGVTDLEPISEASPAEQLRDIESRMAGYGDGARAVIRVKWRNEDRGHVFIAEQVDGETRFVDPQTGSIDCSSHLGGAQPGYTRILRIDDAKLSPLIGKAVRNRRAR